MRWLSTLLLLCTTVPALAQAADDTARQLEAGRTADLQNWAWRAQYGTRSSEAETALQAVLDAVTKRDCAAAVVGLNAGLAKAYPEVITLAGAMYEEGICLKPNWERALNFYQRAVAASHPGAAARVAAAYAAPVGGRDMATALWWAIRAKTAMPAPCVQVAPLAGDADRFVAALNGWPAGQLNACAYAAAVMATIQGEVESPGLASAYGLEGAIRFSFVPEQGRVDVTNDLVEAAPLQGVVIDAAKRESDARAARQALTTHLRQLADRALKRYESPANLAPAWRVEAEYVLKVAR